MQKNNWRRDFRIATFAVFNKDGNQLNEASININDANDYHSVIKSVVKGCYVAQASRVETYTLPLHVSTHADAFDIKHLWDIHIPVLQLLQVKLGLRPDNLPTLLPPIEGKHRDKDGKLVKISKILSDKAGNKHRGKYGGLIDRDNKYIKGEYDPTGIVRFAESANWNKGSSTLPKAKRAEREGAGIIAHEMPDTANVELQQVRLDQLINKLLKQGLSYGQIKRHCKGGRHGVLHLRNSGSQITKTMIRLSNK